MSLFPKSREELHLSSDISGDTVWSDGARLSLVRSLGLKAGHNVERSCRIHEGWEGKSMDIARTISNVR